MRWLFLLFILLFLQSHTHAYYTEYYGNDPVYTGNININGTCYVDTSHVVLVNQSGGLFEYYSVYNQSFYLVQLNYRNTASDTTAAYVNIKAIQLLTPSNITGYNSYALNSTQFNWVQGDIVVVCPTTSRQLPISCSEPVVSRGLYVEPSVFLVLTMALGVQDTTLVAGANYIDTYLYSTNVQCGFRLGLASNDVRGSYIGFMPIKRSTPYVTSWPQTSTVLCSVTNTSIYSPQRNQTISRFYIRAGVVASPYVAPEVMYIVLANNGTGTGMRANRTISIADWAVAYSTNNDMMSVDVSMMNLTIGDYTHVGLCLNGPQLSVSSTTRLNVFTDFYNANTTFTDYSIAGSDFPDTTTAGSWSIRATVRRFVSFGMKLVDPLATQTQTSCNISINSPYSNLVTCMCNSGYTLNVTGGNCTLQTSTACNISSSSLNADLNACTCNAGYALFETGGNCTLVQYPYAHVYGQTNLTFVGNTTLLNQCLLQSDKPVLYDYPINVPGVFSYYPSSNASFYFAQVRYTAGDPLSTNIYVVKYELVQPTGVNTTQTYPLTGYRWLQGDMVAICANGTIPVSCSAQTTNWAGLDASKDMSTVIANTTSYMLGVLNVNRSVVYTGWTQCSMSLTLNESFTQGQYIGYAPSKRLTNTYGASGIGSVGYVSDPLFANMNCVLYGYGRDYPYILHVRELFMRPLYNPDYLPPGPYWAFPTDDMLYFVVFTNLTRPTKRVAVQLDGWYDMTQTRSNNMLRIDISKRNIVVNYNETFGLCIKPPNGTLYYLYQWAMNIQTGSSGRLAAPDYSTYIEFYHGPTSNLSTDGLAFFNVVTRSAINQQYSFGLIADNVTVYTAPIVCPYNVVSVYYNSTTCLCISPYAINITGLTCAIAPAGSYITSNGTISVCANGTFTVLANQTSCNPAPLGSYSVLGVSYECSPGRYSNTTGQSSCYQASPGKYATSGLVALCDVGKYSNTSGVSSCTNCNAGFTTAEAGATSCCNIMIGNAHATYSNCSCNPGYTLNQTTSNCTSDTECAYNHYGVDCTLCTCTDTQVCSTGLTGTGDCTCDPDLTGDTAHFNTSACACDLNYVYNPAEDAKTCTLCDRGNYLASAISCLDCDAGTYSNTAGVSSCTLCGVGFYQETAGQTTCHECNAGDTTEGTGQAVCVPDASSSDDTVLGMSKAVYSGVFAILAFVVLVFAILIERKLKLTDLCMKKKPGTTKYATVRT
jgi:hypothetical protein